MRVRGGFMSLLKQTGQTDSVWTKRNSEIPFSISGRTSGMAKSTID